MEEKKIDNPQAFPGTEEVVGTYFTNTYYHTGMTLRDYFAAKAMNAFITTPIMVTGDSGRLPANEEISTSAYKVADAMLKERLK